MATDPRLLAGMVEAVIPFVGGVVLTTRALRSRRQGSTSRVFWLGPLLLVFSILLAVRPFTRSESQSLLYQSSKELLSRDVAALTYEDFLGTWEAVVDGQAIRRRLTFRFTFKPDGDCTLDYVSFNLDTSAEVKHFYDMHCEVTDGKLMHAAKDPSQGEQYEETHKIETFDGDSFVWSDNFVGPIRYRKQD